MAIAGAPAGGWAQHQALDRATAAATGVADHAVDITVSIERRQVLGGLISEYGGAA